MLCIVLCVVQEFEVEREEMLESIRESSRDTELFREICLALLGEKRLRQARDTFIHMIKSNHLLSSLMH